jgi:hypothetical protein
MTKVGNIFGFATDCNIFFTFSFKSGIYCVLLQSPISVQGYFPAINGEENKAVYSY